MKSIRISVLIILYFLISGISPVFSQDNTVKPRIAVKKLTVSDPDNIQLQIISDRVTDSTGLVLKFMNEYELASFNFSGTDESEKTMLDICNKNNIDNIVYGRTYTGSDNSYVIEMSVFSRGKEQTAFTQKGTAETALDIFEASDKLTASIIEEFSGVHIAFGKIHLINTGVEGSFIPYIDGEPFPPDSYTIENLLIGKRTVEIRQMRMLEETVIYSEELLVKENAVTDASFEIPNLLPAEEEVISDYDKIIDKNWDKLKRRDKTARAFNELDSLLSNTPYNLTLADLRAEYKKKRTEWELNLEKLANKEKREFIAGASMGVTVGMVKTQDDGDGKSDSDYDPIDEDKWNDEIHPAPSFGVNLQYQVFNNFYIQTELNYKEISFHDFEGTENYLKIIEIPVLFKLQKQIDIHRFAMYIGPNFYSIEKKTGIFDNDVSPGLFSYLQETREEIDLGITMGLEYGIKRGRHILTAGLRYTSLSLLDYEFYDVDDDDYYKQRLNASVPEIILGYGYNMGGSGRIVTEENKDKWLFPVDAGLMSDITNLTGSSEFYAGFGALKKVTDSLYLGLKGIGASNGGAPLLSIAYTKDPDKRIDNYSAVVMPIYDMVIGAFQYNIGFKKINLGAFLISTLDSSDFIALGLGAGYFF